MLAPRQLEDRFQSWNWKWKAPHGAMTWRRFLPRPLWRVRPFVKFIGPFAFQTNSSTRAFEYPWAFFTLGCLSERVIVDLGGALSGLPFVLAHGGARVTIVDPFTSYFARGREARDPESEIGRLNRCFGTDVAVKVSDLPGAQLRPASVDSVVCISTIEHLERDVLRSTLEEVNRILKPGGRFLATVDLFLNLFPFTQRMTNEHGSNVRIPDIVEMSGLELLEGKRDELYGYSEFDPLAILTSLERYQLAISYPVLSQAFVLGHRTVG